MGAHEEPRGCSTMDAQKRSSSGYGAGCPRLQKEARAYYVHDGPLAENGPNLREDLKALSREPSRACGCFLKGMVQVDASRHGAPLAVSRTSGSQGGAALAGPRSGGGS